MKNIAAEKMWIGPKIIYPATAGEALSKNSGRPCKASEIKLQQTIWDLLPDLCEEESWAALGVKQKEIDRADDAFGEDH